MQVMVIIPTFRREIDALNQAQRFARMKVVSRVVVIDQAGTLAHDADFAELLAKEKRIRLIIQPNLGGSGGYARGMLESLDHPGEAVLLSDDDAVLGEKTLEIMLEYQGAASRPTIMGTGMASAENPHMLISQAEAVRTRDFMWGPADGVTEPLDLTRSTTERDGVMRLRTPANYTGWWGTLLPPGAVRELGLPAPYFLKWDDADYGLRATARGYDTVVLPQARVTHPTWSAYETQMSWTARILHRNRLATAAAHQAGIGVIASSLVHQMKHILAGHHLTAKLWSGGIDQFLAGPHQWLGKDLTRARMDGQRIVDAWKQHHPEPTKAPALTRSEPLSLMGGLIRAARHLFLLSSPVPVVLALRTDEVTWRTTLGADVVVMVHEDGSVAGTLRPDWNEGRVLLARNLGQHWRMLWRWPRLRRMYRRGLRAVTTVQAWQQIISRAEEEQASHD